MDNGRAGQPWGSAEELLLACAVSRHGGNRWNFIAMELQIRIPNRNLLHFFTPRICEHKYLELKRRLFGGSGGADDDEDRIEVMINELKKLRIAELKLELRWRDSTIGFLEAKVKRLEEERDRSFKSNLEELRDNYPVNDAEEGDIKRDSTKAVAGRSKSVELNSTMIRKRIGHESESKLEPRCNVSELCGSETEMIRGEKELVKGSDQVAGSSTKKKRRRTGKEDAATVKSGPLLRFLNFCRSHDDGSVFEQRVPSQETEEYKKMIKQHMDLQKVERRLRRGLYSGEGSTAKFFRDLLLLVNNTIVFFPKDSRQRTAASALRLRIAQEITSESVLKPCAFHPPPDERPIEKTDKLTPDRRPGPEEEPEKPKNVKRVVAVRRKSLRTISKKTRDKVDDDGAGAGDDTDCNIYNGYDDSNSRILKRKERMSENHRLVERSSRWKKEISEENDRSEVEENREKQGRRDGRGGGSQVVRRRGRTTKRVVAVSLSPEPQGAVTRGHRRRKAGEPEKVAPKG